MLRSLFCRQGTGMPGAVAVSSMLLTITTELAWGQATTPTQPPQQSETDIGRVTATPGQGKNETVVPSATTTRAAAMVRRHGQDVGRTRKRRFARPARRARDRF
jgi:predicted esterase